MNNIIVVTGGVISGLGKGVISSSIGAIMKFYNLKTTIIKIDPYLNCDAGTMSPYEHGEVFVLADGTEADLDLGNYERLINEDLTKINSITSGKIFKSVIEKERKGEYLGKTVQMIPHVTDEVQNQITQVSNKHDITVIELGGTVGDIESMHFIEALRQLKLKMKRKFVHVHISLVPIIGNEHKTKPLQHSVKEIKKQGLDPDILICRTKSNFSNEIKNKISLFCNVEENNIISCVDMQNLYNVPKILIDQNLNSLLFEKMNISPEINLSKVCEYLKYSESYENLLTKQIRNIHIGIIGKYSNESSNQDTYLSIIKALEHCSVYFNKKITYDLLDSCTFENHSEINLHKYDGIIIPGGFGTRGIEGKINCIKHCRINNVPILGICLGFQLMVIEFCRNVLNINTSSQEFDNNTENVICITSESNDKILGGTMVLGEKSIKLDENSKLYPFYKTDIINERHRHRYEVNPKFVSELVNNGLVFTGTNIENSRNEILELQYHKYFVGTQFHPEYKSRPHDPSKVFLSFINECQ